ncbi:MAG TPA: toll/interleukin-1 receptor domain-containing protein [Thermoanaerobaculia bacterium]|nr:toll/interleukin-1 receptor domain-containing protein [Thermoanaerobaculia bacterium]
MANPRHLSLLTEGVEAWNAWRQVEPSEWPDLQHARLPRARLNHCDLQNANLVAADLEDACLAGANLRNANLKDSKLMRADLRGAALAESNLYGSDLREADLSRADLRCANLERSQLGGAKVHLAVLGHTRLDRSFLVGPVGLEQTIHSDSSSVDFRALEEMATLLGGDSSRAAAIQWVCRGGGMPAHLLRYLSVKRRPARVVPRSFVSYSHADQGFASKLVEALRQRRLPCWKDDGHLAIGAVMEDSLITAVIQSDKVLLCCSEHSLTSSWVELEVATAFEKEERCGRPMLLPLDLDGYLRKKWQSPFAAKLAGRLAASFVGCEEDPEVFSVELARVVRALRA